jgi:DNA-binding IclR family transcriptional regulator
MTMAHHDRSIRECVIAVAEEGGLSAITAGELCGVPKSTARACLQIYRRDGQVGRRRGTGCWHISSLAQDTALVAEAQRNAFISARDLKSCYWLSWAKNHAYVIARIRAGRHFSKF